MKMLKRITSIVLCMLLVLSIIQVDNPRIFKMSEVKAAGPTLADVLGVTHVSGRYFNDANTDFLNEGANEIEKLGSKVIKIWLNDKYATKVSQNDSDTDFYDTSMSNGAGNKLNANAAGDFIEYLVGPETTGTFTVKVKVKKHPARGKFQLSIDGVNQGSEQDLYDAGTSYSVIDLGNVTFNTKGDKRFRFTVAGKNASATDYDLAFDYIELVDSSNVSTIYEAEVMSSSNYPYNSNWSQFEPLNNMKQLAQTTYYQNVFNSSHFHTFILEAFAFARPYWKDGLSDDEYNAVYQEFYDLTEYFLTTYQNTGKTFILQNWEGDNALRAWEMTSTSEQDTAIQGMTDWINARQDGINAARNAVNASGVTVAGALEFTRVPVYVTYDHPLVIDRVVPNTYCDLYSWSNWYTKVEGQEWKVPEVLDYIASKTPDVGIYGSDNVYMGEFGCYEGVQMSGTTHDATSDRKQREITMRQLDYALQWGVKYAVYWEIYCNGLRSGVSLLTHEQATEDQLRGVWLIRPGYSITSTYDNFKAIMSKDLSAYNQTWELESRFVTVSTGDSQADVKETDLSAGFGSKLTASASGDYAEYKLDVRKTGTYNVKARFKKDSSNGKFQLAINGTNKGTEQDTYASTSQYVEVDLGNVTLNTTGDNLFKFTVTGKNASSTGYDLVLDYVKLTPAYVPILYEAESLTTTVSSGDTEADFSDSAMSGGYGNKLSADAVNDYVEYTVNLSEAGTYNIKVKVKRHPTRGIFQLSINDSNFGAEQDCYNDSTDYIEFDLGSKTFSSSGNKRFRFTVTGKNVLSSDYDLAFDYIKLTKQ